MTFFGPNQLVALVDDSDAIASHKMHLGSHWSVAVTEAVEEDKPPQWETLPGLRQLPLDQARQDLDRIVRIRCVLTQGPADQAVRLTETHGCSRWTGYHGRTWGNGLSVYLVGTGSQCPCGGHARLIAIRDQTTKPVSALELLALEGQRLAP